MRDRPSLLLLRELLVMVRRWGAARPACLPVFHRGGEQTDVIALLFKLLTKLLTLQAAEPDEALISEYTREAGHAVPGLVQRRHRSFETNSCFEPDCFAGCNEHC